MVERNLGSVALTTTAKPTATASPSHAVARPTTSPAAGAQLDEMVPATEVEGGEERLAKDESVERTMAEGPKRPLCTTVFRWAGWKHAVRERDCRIVHM